MKEYRNELITIEGENRVSVSTKSETKQISLSIDIGVEGYYCDMDILTTKHIIQLLETAKRANSFGFSESLNNEGLENRISIKKKDNKVVFGMDIGVDGLWTNLTIKETASVIEMLKEAVRKVEKSNKKDKK